MPTETRWGSLGLGRRGITPPKYDMEAFLERAGEITGPSVLSRLEDLDAMQLERYARGEAGPARPGSPEADLGLDVASNFEMTGALGGSVRNALGGKTMQAMEAMPGPAMTGGGGASYGLTAGGSMDRYIPPMRGLPEGSPEGVAMPTVKVPLVEPGLYSGATDRLDPKFWKSIQAKEGEPWEPGDLFDYSGLEKVPPMEQLRLERAEGPKKGFPDYLTKVGSSENMKRVNEIVKRGVNIGGREWYNTEPLRKAFVDELGEEDGNTAHQFFTYVMGATSPGSKVDQNIRSASYHFQRARSGQPTIIDPENKGIYRDPKTGVEKETNLFIPEIPEGYGHKYQASHIENMLDLIGEGRLNSKINPKIAGFASNLFGNQYPIAADMHNLRGLKYTNASGVVQDSPDIKHYAYLEDLQRRHAEELGLTPAQYQASMWLAGANETNMSSPVEPFLRTFERHVEYTAKQRKSTKTQVLKDFINGKNALLSVGPMVSMMFRSLLPEDVEVDDLDGDGKPDNGS